MTPELQAAVARCLSKIDTQPTNVQSQAEFFLWLVQTQRIFLKPPHSVHYHGKGWAIENDWTATVSGSVRTWNKPEDRSGPLTSPFGRVGRGRGPDPLTAACAAFVQSIEGES